MDESSERPRLRRGEDALEALAQRSKENVGDRLRRVRLTALPILQSSVGAAAAWWVATSLVGHEQPFFAPIAALISLGGGLAQRLPRVLELMGGVAVGVLIGDALIVQTGTGVLPIAVVVMLAMAAAVFVGGGPIIVTQAASSAALVATLIPPTEEQLINFDRFVDALIGGGVGLLVSIVVIPLNPVSAARRQIDPLLRTLAELLDDAATALTQRDRPAASTILARARETQISVDEVHAALEGANEIARIAPVRWRKRDQLAAYLDAATPVDHLSRNTRVLARHVISMLQRGEPVPDALPQSLRALAGAVRLLRLELERDQEPTESRTSAIVAAEVATEALDQTGGFAGQVVVAQTRSLAMDVLMATGLDREGAQTLLPDLPEGPVSYG